MAANTMDQINNLRPSGNTASGGKRNQACERCWKRKQKCDRVLPACSGCAFVGIECSSRKTDTTSLPEESGLTHASLPSYIASLKRNVDQLESSSRRKRARSNTDASSGTSASALRITNRDGHGTGTANANTASPTSNQASHTRDVRDEGDGSIRATMGEIGFLSRSAMAEPRDELAEIIPMQLSFEKMVVAAVSIDGPDPSSSTLSRSKVPKLIDTSNQPVKITRDTTSSYISLFLDQALIFLPHLDREQVTKDYEGVIIDEESGRSTLSESVSPSRYFRIYMAISIGIILSPDSNRLESVTINLHAAAVALFTQIVKSGNDLATLSCMLTLIVYSIFSTHGGSAWHLVGLAMKKCIAVRLHKESGSQTESSQDETNEERKLFWSLYVIDRTISSVLDRPFAIQDEDISVAVPGETTKYENGNPAMSPTLFRHLIMQAKLISNIRGHNDSSILFHYGNLSFWREIPSSLKNATALSRYLHHHLDQLTCRTLTQLILSGHSSRIHFPLVLGNERTIVEEASTSCARFISQSYERSDSGHSAWSFVHAFDIFSAGVVFVGLLMNQRDSILQPFSQLTKVVSKCTSLLTVISERFPSVRQLRRVIGALLSWAIEDRNSPQHRSTEYQILLHLPSIVPGNIRIFIQQILEEALPGNATMGVTGQGLSVPSLSTDLLGPSGQF